jgi:hypothetical protein
LGLLVFHDREAPEIQRGTLGGISGVGMPVIDLEKVWQNENDPVDFIDLPVKVFKSIAPNFADLSYLTHARQTVNEGVPYGPEYATVMANRLPQPGGTTSVHLVSYEGRFKDRAFDYTSTSDEQPVRLVTLKNWTFTCPPLGADFAQMVQALNPSSANLTKTTAATVPMGVRLPAVSTDSAIVAKRKAEGYVLLPHDQRNGGTSASWYRGPLIGKPHPDEPMHVSSILEADSLYALDAETGLLDVSYGAAWQLGRLMAMRDKAFSLRLYNWKQANIHAENRVESGDVFTALFPDHHGDTSLLNDSDIIHDWFLKLATLANVPFNYLVPDDAMLPQEALRVFHLDWMWIEYLLDGAFSIGRVLEGDQKSDDNHKSDGRIPAHRDITGVMIRSEIVSGWPGLKVAGLRDGQTIEPLRFERLAPDVLMVLFETNVDEISVFLTPETLHFGLIRKDNNDTETSYAAELRINGVASEKTEDVLWRNFEDRVVDISPFADNVRKALGVLAKDFSAANFALQMINGAPSILFKIG